MANGQCGRKMICRACDGAGWYCEECNYTGRRDCPDVIRGGSTYGHETAQHGDTCNECAEPVTVGSDVLRYLPVTMSRIVYHPTCAEQPTGGAAGAHAVPVPDWARD